MPPHPPCLRGAHTVRRSSLAEPARRQQGEPPWRLENRWSQRATPQLVRVATFSAAHHPHPGHFSSLACKSLGPAEFGGCSAEGIFRVAPYLLARAMLLVDEGDGADGREASNLAMPRGRGVSCCRFFNTRLQARYHSRLPSILSRLGVDKRANKTVCPGRGSPIRTLLGPGLVYYMHHCNPPRSTTCASRRHASTKIPEPGLPTVVHRKWQTVPGNSKRPFVDPRAGLLVTFCPPARLETVRPNNGQRAPFEWHVPRRASHLTCASHCVRPGYPFIRHKGSQYAYLTAAFGAPPERQLAIG